MANRFAAKDVLVDALKQQKIVGGNAELAERIAAVGELLEVPGGATIIHQGGDDGEVYLVLAGSFHIAVNGKTIARRAATDHLGEMSAILPLQRRAASVVAQEESAVVRLSDARVAELGDRFPQIWRCFARELAHRLEQRNAVSARVNAKVRVLILAPADATEVAAALQSALDDGSLETVTWSEGAFRRAGYAIENLERALDQSDVAIAVVPRVERGSDRESIIFELGFFIGRLGRHRTFLVEPRADEIKLPPELAGINTMTYRAAGAGKSPQELQAALAPACVRLRKAIHELGPNR